MQILSKPTEIGGEWTGRVINKIAARYFTKMGVFMTPGLVIDGDVISVGKVLSVDEIKQKIEDKV